MTLNWRTQRQIIIFSTYFLIVFIPVALILFMLLRDEANCFDGLQNATEEGVDCGGDMCQLRCDGTYRDIKVMFSRALKVDEGVYDIFTLMENYNTDISFPNVPYDISFYSVEGKLLGSASGSISVYPQRPAVVYIPSLKIAQEPKTIDFTLQAHKALSDKEQIPQNISVESWQSQRGANQGLQVVGELRNPNNTEIKNIDVYALLYDDTKTIYAVSQTKVFSLKGRESTAVTFTWGNIQTPTNIEFVVVPEN
jgi:hypothetical protein